MSGGGVHYNISSSPNLTLIENIIGNDIDDNNEFKGIKCKACGKDCISSSPLFRCARCNYNLHVECGPLPCIIPNKSELHTHPLRLIYSPVGGEDKNDVDVFYCDECENERDPRLPVYCCSEGCPYIAEIKCVISEVRFLPYFLYLTFYFNFWRQLSNS